MAVMTTQSVWREGDEGEEVAEEKSTLARSARPMTVRFNFLLYPAGTTEGYQVWEWHKEMFALEALSWRQQGWYSFTCTSHILVDDTEQNKFPLHLVKVRHHQSTDLTDEFITFQRC